MVNLTGTLSGWCLIETVHCGKTLPRELTTATRSIHTLDDQHCIILSSV